jgi:hypothetical protein
LEKIEMSNPSPTYQGVNWPGADALRIPTERGGFVAKSTQTQASLETYGELDLGTVAASTITLNAQQAGASLITITPTGAVTNLATATYSVTVQIAGNATNTAVVPFLAATGSMSEIVHTGNNGGVMLRNG